MANIGPSPVIPFLLVAVLGLLLHGQSVMEDISLVSEAEDTAFTLVLVIPLVVLLLVYFTTQSLILPIAIMLIIYTVSKMILGPFLLILIIYLLSVHAPSYEFFQGNSYRSAQVCRGEIEMNTDGVACCFLRYFLPCMECFLKEEAIGDL